MIIIKLRWKSKKLYNYNNLMVRDNSFEIIKKSLTSDADCTY